MAQNGLSLGHRSSLHEFPSALPPSGSTQVCLVVEPAQRLAPTAHCALHPAAPKTQAAVIAARRTR
jgi:hypothetical protein